MIVIFDPPVMYTTLFLKKNNTTEVQAPVCLYVLELFLAGSVTVMAMNMK